MGKVVFSIPIGLNKNEKSLKRKIESKQDFLDVAKSALKSADDFYKLANPDLTTDKPDLLANEAFFANCLFACELYTKSILFNFQIKIERKHSLLDLYNLLPDELKTTIKNACENVTVIKVCFDKELKSISDGFEVLRYSYEYVGIAFRYHFIFLYELVLNDIAHQVIK